MRITPLILVVALSFPAPLIALPAASPAAAKPVTGRHVGIVAAVKGSVKINSQTQVGRVINSGEPIYLNDEISTDEKGSLQILLLDQTTFSIGPNSTIVIDKFVYDPDTHDGEVRAKVVKGVFRFVTGKIGQKKPNQMAVDLPVGTIGIRGTIVAGESNGNKSLVALLGPGANNNTQHRNGSFSLQNSVVSGMVKEVVVAKPGFGVTIDEAGVPSNPFEVPEADLNRLASAVAPDGGSSDSSSSSSTGGGDSGDGDSEGDGESPTQQAGQDVASSLDTTGDFFSMAAITAEAGEDSTKASQESLEEEIAALEGSASLISTYEDLISISSGEFHYTQIDIPIYNENGDAVGDYDLHFDIDFSTREVGGGNSRWVINVDDSSFSGLHNFVKNFALEAKQFADSTVDGFAIFDYTRSVSSGDDPDGCPDGCTADLIVTLNNTEGGVIAAHMTSVAVIEDEATDELFVGAKANAPQELGPAPV